MTTDHTRRIDEMDRLIAHAERCELEVTREGDERQWAAQLRHTADGIGSYVYVVATRSVVTGRYATTAYFAPERAGRLRKVRLRSAHAWISSVCERSSGSRHFEGHR